MRDLARAVIVDTLLGSDKRSRLPWLIAIVGVGFGLHRWRGAHDMGVPLDLAFKHPFTPIADLYRQIHMPPRATK
jgi:hypothetical protein